jgi:hypothetical protein
MPKVYFATTTGDAFYDTCKKHGVADVVTISPRRYLHLAADLHGSSYKDELASLDGKKIKDIQRSIAAGKKMPLAYIDMPNKAQDGRHRIAACMAGGIENAPTLFIADPGCVNEYYSLQESSIGRIKKHIERAVPTTHSWALMTAWRGEKQKPEGISTFDWKRQNLQNLSAMKAAIKAIGKSFATVEGVGQETDPETKQVIESAEPSLFVINITLDQARHLSARYNQWGFIYSGPETQNKVGMFETEKNDPSSIATSFNIDQIRQFFTRIKKHKFSFDFPGM